MNLKTTSLEIKPVTEKDEILSVLLDADIYNRIADDTCPSREHYIFDDMGATFIGGYVVGKLIGLIIYHDQQIHVNILAGYRQHKSALWHGALHYIQPPFYAKIPTLFPSIIAFAESEGFVLNEVIKDDYTKDGESYDVHVMRYDKAVKHGIC